MKQKQKSLDKSNNIIHVTLLICVEFLPEMLLDCYPFQVDQILEALSDPSFLCLGIFQPIRLDGFGVPDFLVLVT